MAGAKVYSFEEVAKNRDRKACWLIIAGKVYDLTQFLEEHPGGDEVLLACTAKDATADFDDIGHSDAAKEMMPQYCIGEVDRATLPAKVKFAVCDDAPTKPPAKGTGALASLLQLAAPVMLLGAALAFALQGYVTTKAE